eukprot:6213098-Pleurochrysis_carterae.AAC.3
MPRVTPRAGRVESKTAKSRSIARRRSRQTASVFCQAALLPETSIQIGYSTLPHLRTHNRMEQKRRPYFGFDIQHLVLQKRAD